MRTFLLSILWFSVIFFLNTNIAANSKNKLKVITTFTILADMAQNVAGNLAKVQSITKPGAEIHGYQPTPRDISKVKNADLILWNGLNLEIWFEKFFVNFENIPSALLTKDIVPISIKYGDYEGKPNPHAWMSVENSFIYIDNIEKALSKIDIENEQTYKLNAKNYKKKILNNMQPIKEKILSIPTNKRWLVSCEGAFSYLAEDYKMKELYIWPTNSDSMGTPKQVKNVIDIINENNIKVIFCESTVSQKPALQIAEETNISYGGKLYVDSLSKKKWNCSNIFRLIKKIFTDNFGRISS